MTTKLAQPEDETSDWNTVICPWCLHRHRDAFEMVDYVSENWIDGKCGRCDKSIRFRVETRHTYHCEPIQKESE